MKNTFKDFTVNVKKSIDREYDGESNMEPDYDDSQKVVDDNVISSIENSYEDDYEDYNIVVDNPDDDISLIEPETSNVDMIRLIKVKTINELSEQLENVNKTGVPAIIDLKYIQERRVSEFKKLGSTLKAFKSATNANVVLLGSTKNVIVVTPEEIRILKE
ncbi:MAG: hypothetical protein VZR33_04975 [Methanosphaera sp.]|uniref:hypothetical protein n=1 Tax=Methanosphaera sp. TaxID=2666342 RepID=UPI002E7807F8|nr:hypothetical protein [Methanosphaera sp.]MEE1118030.1 hypothetical protein [Methanosphaera sp.]MEE3324667.1 hypothetical protein [Methanosphaera sp.]MEE3419150.1 hypothetical protein [Methanosphaera sp.]